MAPNPTSIKSTLSPGQFDRPKTLLSPPFQDAVTNGILQLYHFSWQHWNGIVLLCTVLIVVGPILFWSQLNRREFLKQTKRLNGVFKTTCNFARTKQVWKQLRWDKYLMRMKRAGEMFRPSDMMLKTKKCKFRQTIPWTPIQVVLVCKDGSYVLKLSWCTGKTKTFLIFEVMKDGSISIDRQVKLDAEVGWLKSSWYIKS